MLRFFEVRVMDELANGFRGAAHVTPTNMEALLAKHAHPASSLVASEGNPYGHAFEGFEQAPAHGSPDENDPEPTGEGDHNEGKEESGNEEFVERGGGLPDEGAEEKPVEAVNVGGEDTEAEENHIDETQN